MERCLVPAFVFAFNNKADQRHFLCWLHRLSMWESLPYELAASVGRRASLYGVSWPRLTMLFRLLVLALLS